MSDPEVERLAALKAKVASLRRRRDKARGALGEVMARLKKEHGCSSLEEAEKMLRGTKREARRLEREFARGLRAFERKWGDALK